MVKRLPVLPVTGAPVLSKFALMTTVSVTHANLRAFFFASAGAADMDRTAGIVVPGYGTMPARGGSGAFNGSQTTSPTSVNASSVVGKVMENAHVPPS
jgi:hypothetical protein